MARKTSSLVIVLFAAVVGVVGCKQGAGERCEVPRDCQDGYTCRNQKCDPIETTMDASPSDVTSETSADRGNTEATAEVATDTAAEAAAETGPETGVEAAAEVLPVDANSDATDATTETSNDDGPVDVGAEAPASG